MFNAASTTETTTIGDVLRRQDGPLPREEDSTIRNRRRTIRVVEAPGGYIGRFEFREGCIFGETMSSREDAVKSCKKAVARELTGI